jgi:glycosyltransferase involved in cell wall biosynthesis
VELEDLPAARRENASWRGWLDWLSTLWLVRGAKLVTCVSPGAAATLQSRLAIDAKHLRLLPPLLQEGFLRAVEQREPPFRRRFIRVLYAGGYSAEKGVEDLLWAFQALPPSSHRLHLVGPVTSDIRTLARAMPHVYVHGCVTEGRLHSCYQQVDVVVNPHRAILNGSHVFPFKTIEQIACGALPLLSTSLGADQTGLPQACLFGCREDLLVALENSSQIWHVHHQSLTTLAANFRHSHAVSTVAEQFASLFSSFYNH